MSACYPPTDVRHLTTSMPKPGLLTSGRDVRVSLRALIRGVAHALIHRRTRPITASTARADVATWPIVRMLMLALLLTGASLCAHARDAAPLANDPALEARVMEVAEELRCLVCQNETIAASQADLAVDLRQQIRQKLRQGETQAQILDFMVQRYGAFVRYRPALNPTTALLWMGPFGLLAVAAFVLAKTLRRRRLDAPPNELNEAERQRLHELLDSGRA